MTKRIMVGSVPVGGGAPVSIQSMLNTPAKNAAACIAQAKALHDELEAVYNPHVDFARVYALAHAHALQLLG